jgi:methylated-DNA-[protein]-cysteine S-methyltransferase
VTRDQDKIGERRRRKMPAQYTILRTALGWVAAAYSPRGLLAVTLPRHSQNAARRDLQGKVTLPLTPGKRYTPLIEDLTRYFQGEAVAFHYPLDLRGATPFQRKVWGALQKIPRGETRSYQEIAAAIRRPLAARAVGQAVGANPLAIIIPCHRVIASNGSLGGYADGLPWKRRLLTLEKASLLPRPLSAVSNRLSALRTRKADR